MAPMTITLSVLDVFKPSISCMNSVMTPRCANPPPVSREDDRAPKSASISSMKTTQGANLLANENTERTSFSPSPTYFQKKHKSKRRVIKGRHETVRTMSITSEGDIASMRHPASFASARTTSVFPVPGGPNNKQPVILCSFKTPC